MNNTRIPSPNELPSTPQLLRSTIVALMVAAILVVTVVLPAEYGSDPTRIGRLLGLTQMGEIKRQLAEESAIHHAQELANATAVAAPTLQRTDTTTVTLQPNEGVEYKLEMSKGARAKYEWVSLGGPVNHNLHTDTPNDSHSYRKGSGVEKDSGELTAVSDGYHGWFWRNRNANPVTITLKTSGDYKNLKKMEN